MTHKDIRRADVVHASERKPQVPANCLEGAVHHQVAVARLGAQQDVVIIRQLVIPKEPQALALESALDGTRLGEDFTAIHEASCSDDGEDNPLRLVYRREAQLLDKLEHLRGRAQVRDGDALVSDHPPVQRQAVRTVLGLHDPVGQVTETHRLTADRALAENGAYESHHFVAIDKHPAEVIVLQPAVINEEMSPVLLL